MPWPRPAVPSRSRGMDTRAGAAHETATCWAVSAPNWT
jgi:hypothetical protein